MSEADLELVRKVNVLLAGNWVELFGDSEQSERQLEAIRPLVHEEVEYRAAGLASQLGFAEAYHGPEGFIEATRQFVREFEHFSVETEELIDVGDGRVLIHGWNVLRTRGGDDMRFPGHALVTIEKGLITRYETFTSRADAEQASGA